MESIYGTTKSVDEPKVEFDMRRQYWFSLICYLLFLCGSYHSQLRISVCVCVCNLDAVLCKFV